MSQPLASASFTGGARKLLAQHEVTDYVMLLLELPSELSSKSLKLRYLGGDFKEFLQFTIKPIYKRRLNRLTAAAVEALENERKQEENAKEKAKDLAKDNAEERRDAAERRERSYLLSEEAVSFAAGSLASAVSLEPSVSEVDQSDQDAVKKMKPDTDEEMRTLGERVLVKANENMSLTECTS